MLGKEKSFKVLFALSIIVVIAINIAIGIPIKPIVGSFSNIAIDIGIATKNGIAKEIIPFSKEVYIHSLVKKFGSVDPIQAEKFLYLRLSNHPLDEIIKILGEKNYQQVLSIEEWIKKEFQI